MEANRKRTRWTYAEYARLPSEGSTRYEVIDGEVVVTPAPSRSHQRIATDLITLLNAWVKQKGTGQVFAAPFDVLLGEDDFMEPDLLFVRKDRLQILTDRGCEGPPDLIIEIISPSTAARDRGIKRDRYRLFGVAEYWIVDPDARAIQVWDLAGEADAPRPLGASDTLRWTPEDDGPTLEIPLAELFAHV